jgi:hypothetical protein
MGRLSHWSRLLMGGLTVFLAGTLGLAAPGAQGASAGPRLRIVGERDQPYGTIAWTGSIAVITESSTNGDLYYWWNPGGDTRWHQEVVAKASSSIQYSDPAIAWTGTYDTSNPAVVITATGSNGDLYYWWQKADSKTWHKQLVAAGTVSRPYRDPSIAATSTSVVIAATGSGASLHYWYQLYQTTPWHGHDLGRQYLSASIGWTGSNVVLAAVNAAPRQEEGNVDYWWNRGGNTTWHQQTVAAQTATTAFSAPSLAVAKNAVLIAANANTEIYYWYQRFGTSKWHQQIAASSAGFSNPSIAWANNTAVITVPGVALPEGLFVYYQPYGTKLWHQQTVAPSGVYFIEGASIAGTSGATVIAGLLNPDGDFGDVKYFSQAYGTTPWNGQTVASKCC